MRKALGFANDICVFYRRIFADVIVSSFAYDLTHRSRGRIYELNTKVKRAD